MKSIVEYYYMWKTTDRYVQQASCERSLLSAVAVLLEVDFYGRPM